MTEESKAEQAKPEATDKGKALRPKPELVTIGNRQITSTGMWNDNLMMDYLEANSKDRWITVGELAKVAWGQNTITTKKRARSYLSRVLRALLIERSLIMIVERMPPHNRAQAVKIYNKDREDDRQALGQRLDNWKTMIGKNSELYDMALALLEADSKAA